MIEKLRPYIKTDSIVVRSPGRINLIGEHTDYNEGFVLPAAIDKSAYVVVTPRKDNEIHLYSIDLKDSFFTTVDELKKTESTSWPNYLLGIVAQFKKKNIIIPGFDVFLTGDIPLGGGLSSSAAVECAMAFALNILTNSDLDKLTLIKMAQLAEHEYAGVKCGIMDQFASVMGKKNFVMKLDCRSLEYEYIPLKLDGYKIVLLDTNVKHSLASSEYNQRRLQCETGVSIINNHVKHVKSLRDVNLDMLNKYVLPADKIVYNRCRYVIEENDRLLNACVDLASGDFITFGKRMFETHDGLSNLYEVSCPELNFLVSQVKTNPAVVGSRMMGGGFGGCTINIVKAEAVESLIREISVEYQTAMQKELSYYLVSIEAGTTIVKTI